MIDKNIETAGEEEQNNPSFCDDRVCEKDDAITVPDGVGGEMKVRRTRPEVVMTDEWHDRPA